MYKDDDPRSGYEDDLRLMLRKKVLLARQDSVEFVKFIGRQEGNRPIRMGKVHTEWQRILDQNDRVALFAPVGHGKSNQITLWRLLYEIGKNPNIRIGVVSVSKSGVPTKFLRSLKSYIERNKHLRLVFPHLRPSTSGQKMWSEDGIIVERTDNSSDPTIQMFGVHGHILGSRLDLILIDDICNIENTLTEYSREKMWKWVSGEVLSRLPNDAHTPGRVWAVGHVWHKEDVMHRLARQNGVKKAIYSAFKKNEETGEEEPLIPELWTLKGLKRREQELGRLAPYMLRNIIPAFDDSRIKQSWVERCLERGRGQKLLKEWDPADSPAFTGVDLSVASGKGGDLACVFTMTVLPDGTRRLLDIRSGRWTGPKILKELVDIHQRYGSLIMVESNAAQDYLAQFAGEISALPLKKHYTGANKRDWQWGIESLGTEFEQAKWIIPCDVNLVPSAEVASWIQEATTYVPNEHTGDRLMASWIARECARKSGYGQGNWALEKDVNFFDVDTLTR